MIHPLVWWSFFGVIVTVSLALDLGFFNRKAHVIGTREALGWSAAWIALALLFNLGILLFWQPTTPGGLTAHQATAQFLTGYLLEKSLSIDNLFIFLMLFTYFRVEAKYQHRVLFWGILGALAMRGLLIWAGVELVHRFEFLLIVFGLFLFFAAFKMIWLKDEGVHPDKNPVIRVLRRILPISESYENGHFWIRRGGRWVATPLLVVLVAVETTDLVFAVDSIPAILGISRDLFIIYTSNVFAILGLRALYFALAGILRYFRYLNYGLAAVLAFIGAKMCLESWIHISEYISMGVIGVVLGLTCLLSLLAGNRGGADPPNLA